jgi:hypothetical protein
VGEDSPFLDAIEKIPEIAASDAPVLLLGETLPVRNCAPRPFIG